MHCDCAQVVRELLVAQAAPSKPLRLPVPVAQLPQHRAWSTTVVTTLARLACARPAVTHGPGSPSRC